MKIAISGKGGVGKSTVAAGLALTLSKRGSRVLALDADPDYNLASALGVTHAKQESIVPISRQIDLIEERTGAKVSQYGQVFQINPNVSDIAEKYAYDANGVALLVLGAVKRGGGGCACPENTFIGALVTDIVMFKNDTLIMDMEAGIEHLGRATASGVDMMLVVIEPGQRAVDCAEKVLKLCGDIRLKHIMLVGNKITCKEDEEFLRAAFPNNKFLAMLPFLPAVRNADRDGVSVLDGENNELVAIFEKMADELSQN